MNLNSIMDDFDSVEIKKLIKGGDEGGWRVLIKSHENLVYHILHELKVLPSDMDDLAQEVFVKISQKMELFDETKGTFKTWVGAITRNQCFSYFRGQKSYGKKIESYSEVYSEELSDRRDGIEVFVEGEWREFILSEALYNSTNLFEDYAVKVFQLYVQGVKTDEIVNALKIKKSIVYKCKSRMTTFIKREVERMIKELN